MLVLTKSYLNLGCEIDKQKRWKGERTPANLLPQKSSYKRYLFKCLYFIYSKGILMEQIYRTHQAATYFDLRGYRLVSFRSSQAKLKTTTSTGTIQTVLMATYLLRDLKWEIPCQHPYMIRIFNRVSYNADQCSKFRVTEKHKQGCLQGVLII